MQTKNSIVCQSNLAFVYTMDSLAACFKVQFTNHITILEYFQLLNKGN